MTMGAMARNSCKWDDRFYVKCYQLAMSGMDDTKIARALSLKPETFYRWVKERPALKDALEQARSRGAGTRAFMRMISQRIPDDIRPLWEQLSDDDDDKRASAYATIKKGDQRRAQHLWVHAYIACNFNENKATDMTGLTNNTIALWKRNDRHFKGLLQHIKECRKEFGQNCLMDRMVEGDTAAIIFFNKTFNKDLGYDTRIQIDVKGEVEHKTSISLDALPPDKLRELLELARAKRAAQIEDRSKVQDAEFEIKE